MTASKKSGTTDTPADPLTATSPEANVELSEAALGQASGGAVFPSVPAVVKLGATVKIEDPNILPAVQKN